MWCRKGTYLMSIGISSVPDFDNERFVLVQSLLVMRMHLINPSITRQFISERLEEPANGDTEPETSDRWRNLAVRQ